MVARHPAATLRPRQNDLDGRMMKKHNIDAREVLLADLCYPDQIGQYGIPAAGEPYTKDKNRYLRITDISDDGLLLDTDKKGVSGEIDERYFLSGGDVVFARTGNSTGRSYLYDKNDGRLVYAGFLIKYKLDPTKVNPRYIHYFTQSAYYKAWVKNLSGGSTRGNISATTFAECPIYLPDRIRQDYLVNVLSVIDCKIALNRKRIATLEAMAKEIYDYWFVQFDFPDAHGRPYKSSGGAMVYNPDLKREIPKGWAIKTVGDIANVVTGKEDASFATDNGMYPFFTCSQKVLKCDEYKFDGKNVLVAGNGEFCVKHYIGKCNAYQRTYVISPSNVNYWGAVYIEAQRAIDRFKRCSSGSIVKFITMGDVRGLIVYCPANIDLYDPINQCLEQIENQEREIVELSALRDFLLPVLMNGQVKVG